MPFWTEIYFMNANSPSMEQMIFFYDYSMIMMSSIIFFLFIFIVSMKWMNMMNLNLMENQMVEIIWTIIPMVILLLIAIPSLRLLYLMEELFNPILTMKITGHQWYWSYEYSNFKISFDSFIKPLMTSNKNIFRLLETDNLIFIPSNTNTRMLVTSADVIHSWTIQTLGLKVDAIPGRLNQLNLNSSRPGTYFGQCSEICGTNHSFMPITLKISNMKNFLNYIKNMS